MEILALFCCVPTGALRCEVNLGQHAQCGCAAQTIHDDDRTALALDGETSALSHEEDGFIRGGFIRIVGHLICRRHFCRCRICRRHVGKRHIRNHDGALLILEAVAPVGCLDLSRVCCVGHLFH